MYRCYIQVLIFYLCICINVLRAWCWVFSLGTYLAYGEGMNYTVYSMLENGVTSHTIPAPSPDFSREEHQENVEADHQYWNTSTSTSDSHR